MRRTFFRCPGKSLKEKALHLSVNIMCHVDEFNLTFALERLQLAVMKGVLKAEGNQSLYSPIQQIDILHRR